MTRRVTNPNSGVTVILDPVRGIHLSHESAPLVPHVWMTNLQLTVALSRPPRLGKPMIIEHGKN